MAARSGYRGWPAAFEAKDGRLVMCVGAANRGLAERMLKGLNIYDDVIAAGFVDKTPYNPENAVHRGHNLAEPNTISWEYSTKLAEMVAEAFKKKTAAEWERTLCVDYRTPCVTINSWEEWKNDASARSSLIFAPVEGLDELQIGRTGWIDTARPYPPLKAAAAGSFEGSPSRDLTAAPQSEPHRRPLEGLTLADFCNVVAGPNSGRIFAELGARVIKIDPIDPRHSPEIMVVWAGESGTGKESIILNMATDDGRAIMRQILAECDGVVANKLDRQWEHIGIDRASLDALKPGILQVALTGHRGESKDNARHDYPGYDPALQGTTGIMVRFGPEGCPTFHGLASCVDYLCGYLGTWAGLCALYAQTRRGDQSGDWAETSLAVAATLTQCLLQYADEPVSARGADATGQTEGARVYQLSSGWIYVHGDRDLTAELAGLDTETALSQLAEKGVLAVPVQTCQELAERHLAEPTPTVVFTHRSDKGWTSGVFDTTWFAVEDGKGLGSPHAAHRIGTDAHRILGSLGYSEADVDRLIADQIVGAQEFSNTTAE